MKTKTTLFLAVMVLLAAGPGFAQRLAPPAPLPKTEKPAVAFEVNQVRMVSGKNGRVKRLLVQVLPITESGGCAEESPGGCADIIVQWQPPGVDAIFDAINKPGGPTLPQAIFGRLKAAGKIPAGCVIDASNPWRCNMPAPAPPAEDESVELELDSCTIMPRSNIVDCSYVGKRPDGTVAKRRSGRDVTKRGLTTGSAAQEILSTLATDATGGLSALGFVTKALRDKGVLPDGKVIDDDTGLVVERKARRLRR